MLKMQCGTVFSLQCKATQYANPCTLVYLNEPLALLPLPFWGSSSAMQSQECTLLNFGDVPEEWNLESTICLGHGSLHVATLAFHQMEKWHQDPSHLFQVHPWWNNLKHGITWASDQNHGVFHFFHQDYLAHGENLELPLCKGFVGIDAKLPLGHCHRAFCQKVPQIRSAKEKM